MDFAERINGGVALCGLFLYAFSMSALVTKQLKNKKATRSK